MLALVLVSAAASAPAAAFVWPNVPEQVARALSSGEVSERRLAAQRIAELPGEIGLKLAAQAMGDPDVEVRLRAAGAAVTLRMPKAGDQVIGWLAESDARLRLAACDVIHAAPTDRSVAALGRVLSDPDPHVPWQRVEESAKVLGALGGEVTLRRYPGLPHVVNDDEIAQARALLAPLAE